MAKNSKKSRNFHPDLETIICRGPLKIFIWNTAEGWPVEYVSENISSFGYSCEDFYSGKIKYSDIIHPDDRSNLKVCPNCLEYVSTINNGKCNLCGKSSVHARIRGSSFTAEDNKKSFLEAVEKFNNRNGGLFY